MRIALTGAAGFIGSAIARHLAAANHRVRGLVRPGSGTDHIAPFVDRLIEADLSDEPAWPAFLDSADLVIHNSVDRRPWDDAEPHPLDLHLQSNLVTSIKLLRASRPRPFIFISSMAIHRDLALNPTEADPDSHDLPGPYYAAYKASVEAHLRAEHGRHCITIRPSMVYGIDPKLERSRGYDLILSLRAGKAFRQPGWGLFVHVDDVAATVASIASSPSDSPRALDLVDCYLRHADVAAMAAEILGLHADIDYSGPSAPPFNITPTHHRGPEGFRQHLIQLAALMPRA